MSDPVLGQISMASFNFAPVGYALCDGQTITISQNPALFALLGTRFGGDGITEFKLPDLRGRVPVGKDTGDYTVGTTGGQETVQLSIAQIPAHTHNVEASLASGNSPLPDFGRVLAVPSEPIYSTSTTNLQKLYADSVGYTGGDAPHQNMGLSAVISYMIATAGVFPSIN